MLRLHHCAWLVLAIIVACSTTVHGAPPEKPLPKQAKPKFPEMEVYLNILSYQGKKYEEGRSGCGTKFQPKQHPDVQFKHGIKCGYPGEVSRVRWEYKHTDKEGDHYVFARQFPWEGIDQETPEKEIVFQGKPIVVFEDESHRVTLHVQKPEKEEAAKP